MSEESKAGFGGLVVGFCLGTYLMGSTMKCARVDPLEQEAVKRGHAEFASPDPMKRTSTEFRWLDKPSPSTPETVVSPKPADQ